MKMKKLRNGIAKALRNPCFKQRVVPNKKKQLQRLECRKHISLVVGF